MFLCPLFSGSSGNATAVGLGEGRLLADAGKFYSSAMCLITSLNQYAGVITDKEFSKAELKQLQEKSVNIIPAADASL